MLKNNGKKSIMCTHKHIVDNKNRPNASSTGGVKEDASHENMKTDWQRFISDHSVGTAQKSKKLKKT